MQKRQFSKHITFLEMSILLPTQQPHLQTWQILKTEFSVMSGTVGEAVRGGDAFLSASFATNCQRPSTQIGSATNSSFIVGVRPLGSGEHPLIQQRCEGNQRGRTLWSSSLETNSCRLRDFGKSGTPSGRRCGILSVRLRRRSQGRSGRGSGRGFSENDR
jgi:hypothetical protein